MTTLITGLALSLALATSLLAEPNWPAEVLVGTEPTAAKEFKNWASEDAGQFGGTYKGDVGGDSTGELTIKIASKPGAVPVLVSGTYTLKPAGSAPTTVKFDKFYYYGEDGPSFNGFSLSFVLLDATPGVIIGNVFLKKE